MAKGKFTKGANDWNSELKKQFQMRMPMVITCQNDIVYSGGVLSDEVLFSVIAEWLEPRVHIASYKIQFMPDFWMQQIITLVKTPYQFIVIRN